MFVVNEGLIKVREQFQERRGPYPEALESNGAVALFDALCKDVLCEGIGLLPAGFCEGVDPLSLLAAGVVVLDAPELPSSSVLAKAAPAT